MTKFRLLLIAAVTLQLGVGVGAAREHAATKIGAIDAADLPKEARTTLALIKKGGPFPYQRDGVVFGNFERRLPSKDRGYYKEYTVPTPGAGGRGARRIIAGGTDEYFYTGDHYRTFRRIRE
ncbi:MAG TPA: ribonuclease domain-containing protein [Candidatus Limnocylindrales bacterium]|nr:ribonuclease domain-containing protein [Candidatus Limnocylindrales bacterium]